MVSVLLFVACSDDKNTPWTGTPDGLANCYMVTPEGKVTIPITRAITIGGMDASSEATVEILWDDAGVISNSPTLSGSGASRKIRVKTSYRQGNAVIAIKGTDTGTIYWSWHIWVVDYDPNTGGTWSNNGYTFMDRNLGATDNQLNPASWGLLYQWGRKDPFPGCKHGTAGYAALSRFKGMTDAGSKEGVSVRAHNLYDGVIESVRNPTTFFSSRDLNWLPQKDDHLWNGDGGLKTVYDPCPAGWRAHITDRTAENASPWNGIKNIYWIDTHGERGYSWGRFANWPATQKRISGGEPVEIMWHEDPREHRRRLTIYYLQFNYGIHLTGTPRYPQYGETVRCNR
jgi:hypothetical protein